MKIHREVLFLLVKQLFGALLNQRFFNLKDLSKIFVYLLVLKAVKITIEHEKQAQCRYIHYITDHMYFYDLFIYKVSKKRTTVALFLSLVSVPNQSECRTQGRVLNTVNILNNGRLNNGKFSHALKIDVSNLWSNNGKLLQWKDL